MCTNVNKTDKEMVYYEPDEDFYRSISTEELLRRVKEDIHQWYKERNENTVQPEVQQYLNNHLVSCQQ